MRIMAWIVSYLAEEAHCCRIRCRCIRHGHKLLCITNGHVCTKCGRFWD